MEYIALLICVLIIILLIVKKWYLILVAFLINLPLLPLSFMFSIFGSEAPDSNIFDALVGFLFIQWPLVLLLIASIVYTIVVHRKKKQVV